MGRGVRVDKRRSIVKRSPRCAYCRVPLVMPSLAPIEGGLAATVDHVIPSSQGGSNDRSNLVACCPHCNIAKADRTPQQWAADILAVLDR